MVNFRSLEKFLFGKVSGGGTKIFSSSESESDEDEPNKQKPQWSSIQAKKSSDSEPEDKDGDKKDKSMFLLKFQISKAQQLYEQSVKTKKNLLKIK